MIGKTLERLGLWFLKRGLAAQGYNVVQMTLKVQTENEITTGPAGPTVFLVEPDIAKARVFATESAARTYVAECLAKKQDEDDMVVVTEFVAGVETGRVWFSDDQPFDESIPLFPIHASAE